MFVHGSFGWGLDTFPYQRELADRYRIHLLDRAGYGDSPPAGQLGWPTDMHDVADVLGSLKCAHLAGQSYGGVVALLAAGLRPECVRSLVAVEPPLFDAAPQDPGTAALAEALRLLEKRAEEDTVGYFADWARTALNRDPAGVEALTGSWGDRDWSAAESSRRERSRVDARSRSTCSPAFGCRRWWRWAAGLRTSPPALRRVPPSGRSRTPSPPGSAPTWWSSTGQRTTRRCSNRTSSTRCSADWGIGGPDVTSPR